MRTTWLIVLLTIALLVPFDTAADAAGTQHADLQQQGPGRGDDLALNEAWRAFLGRADRAFFAARMSTTDVQKWLREAREAEA